MKTRPFYWSVRRELWESRAIYIAPLGVAAAVLLGLLIGALTPPGGGDARSPLEAARRELLARPYDYAAMLMILSGFVVGVVYCLGALQRERRDRTILFWKSLPVSDLTTVLAKASIPLVVIPLLTFAIVVAMQLIMLLLSRAVLLAGGPADATWTRWPVLPQSLILLYGLIGLAAWHAPLYGLLLLVSGWARRATFLWVVLPPLAISGVEKIAFDTSHFAATLMHRLTGHAEAAFDFNPDGFALSSATQLAPGRFLSTPGLWLGLALAAAFLAAAVRLRRYQEPL
jgi:ABC-2 type transport system permease protein